MGKRTNKSKISSRSTRLKWRRLKMVSRWIWKDLYANTIHSFFLLRWLTSWRRGLNKFGRKTLQLRLTPMRMSK